MSLTDTAIEERRTLYVGRLSNTATEANLQHAFSRCGAVTKVNSAEVTKVASPLSTFATTERRRARSPRWMARG